MPHFVFAYGSLINSESRQRSSVEVLDSFPVVIKGYQRGWFLHIQTDKCCASGLIQNTNAVCNGVIIEVSDEGLRKLDERELAHAYKRISISNSCIQGIAINQTIPPSVRVYYTENPQFPQKDYLLIQFYIDVIITGFLEYRHDFANTFVETTEAWDNAWIDDRQQPRYPRSMHVEDKSIIDHSSSDIIRFRSTP